MGCFFRFLFLPVTILMVPLQFAISVLRTVLIFVLRLLGIQIVVSGLIPSLLYVKHSFKPEGDENGVIFEIEGRQPGFIAFIMRVLGIHNRSVIRVTNEEIRISSISIFETYHHVVPLNTITTTHYQTRKRVWLAFLAIAVPILLIPTGVGVVIGLIFSLIFAVMYWFYREMVIGFSTGDVDGIAGLAFFKRGLVSKNITHKELVRIFHHVDRNIVQAHLDMA